MRDEVELLDGIDTGSKGHVVVVDLIVVHAVEDVVVGLLAVAVDVGTADLEAGLGPVNAPGLRLTAPGESRVSWL